MPSWPSPRLLLPKPSVHTYKTNKFAIWTDEPPFNPQMGIQWNKNCHLSFIEQTCESTTNLNEKMHYRNAPFGCVVDGMDGLQFWYLHSNRWKKRQGTHTYWHTTLKVIGWRFLSFSIHCTHTHKLIAREWILKCSYIAYVRTIVHFALIQLLLLWFSYVVIFFVFVSLPSLF